MINAIHSTHTYFTLCNFLTIQSSLCPHNSDLISYSWSMWFSTYLCTLFMCCCKLCARLKFFLQIRQWISCLFIWIAVTWRSRSCFNANFEGQCRHLRSLISKCLKLTCVFKTFSVDELKWHNSQLWSRILPCTRLTCLLRLWKVDVSNSHILHLKFLTISCTARTCQPEHASSDYLPRLQHNHIDHTWNSWPCPTKTCCFKVFDWLAA